MPKNSLFNIVSEVTRKETNIPGVEKKPSRLRHKQGNEYFLFDLPKKETTIGPYILLNHHLSVYEGAISKLDLNSQYHYTAYFSDSSKKDYRLHIYFDAYDEYDSEPLLSVKKENNYEDIGDMEYQEAFKTLAQLYIAKLIAHLRQTQRKLVSDLQQKLDILEKEAIELSKDLDKNSEVYLNILDKQVVLLQQQECYSNPKRLREIKANIFSIQNRKEGLAEKNVTSKTDEKTQTLEIKLDTRNQIIPTQTNSQTTSLSIEKSLHTKKKKIELSLSQRLQDLKKEFGYIIEDKKYQRIDEIEKLWFNLVEIEAEIVIGIYQTGLKTIDKGIYDLRSLKESIETFGLDLLQQALMTEDFERAKKLVQFYPLVPENILQVALRLNKSKLIHFLLANKISRLNSNFTIRDTTYHSIAEYYFQKSPISTEDLNSFDAFVKNGFSLMSLDKKTGLPFAAILLSDPKHPLYPVLEKNSNSTIQNPRFYTQLNEVLKVLIASSTYSKENADLIKGLFSANLNKITQLSSTNSSSHTKIMNKLSANSSKSLGDKLLEQVKAEPVVLERHNHLLTRETELFKTLTKNKINAVTAAVKKLSMLTKKFIDSMNLDEIPSKDTLVIMLRYEILKAMELCDLYAEKVEIERKLLNKPLEKLNKAERQLYDRKEEIEEILKNYYKCFIKNLNYIIIQNAIVEHMNNQLKLLTSRIDALTSYIRELTIDPPSEDLLADFLRFTNNREYEQFSSAPSSSTSKNEPEPEKEIECRVC